MIESFLFLESHTNLGHLKWEYHTNLGDGES